MFKRIASILLALCLLFATTPFASFAADTVSNGNCGDNLTWELDSQGTLTIKGSGELSVKNIQWDASKIVSLVIENGVTAIGDGEDSWGNPKNGAFMNAPALTSVTLPASLTKIGDNAFYNCTHLVNINLSEGLTTIGKHAFTNAGTENPSLSAVLDLNIPSSVLEIDEQAFSAAVIRNLTIGDGDMELDLDKSVFENCTKLISANIPGRVREVPDGLFQGCTALAQLDIGEGVETIDDGEYSWGNPKSGAFMNCSAITSVKFPSTLKSIGNMAFCYCGQLSEVSFNDGLVSIGENAFLNAGIEKRTLSGTFDISIPSSVLKIGKSAFASSIINSAKIADGDLILELGEGVFEKCDKLTSANVPGRARVIPNKLFMDCTALKDLQLTEGTETIENGEFSWGNPSTGAFMNCTALQSIVIPSSVKTIGDIAFCGCTNLTSVTLNEGLVSIGSEAFTRVGTEPATAVSEFAINIPSTVTEIKESAFSESAITSVTMPDSDLILTLGKGIFEKCAALTSAEIAGRARNIPNRMFMDCTALNDVSINEGIETIENGEFSWGNPQNGAFMNCTALKSIILPSTLKSLGDCAFTGCTALTNAFVTSGSLTTIGASVFDGCTSMTHVTLNKELKSIAKKAFNGTILTDVYFTGSVNEWSAIAIDEGNEPLFAATIHYNEEGPAGPVEPEPTTPPATEPPVTEPPTTEPPVTKPTTEPPTTEPTTVPPTNEPTTVPPTTEPTTVPPVTDAPATGDVNGNGGIDAGDATMVLRYAVGMIKLTDGQIAFADMNNNGTVDASDATLILRKVVGVGQ